MWRLVLLLFCNSAFGMTETENTTIENIVKDCNSIHYYTDTECFEVILSTGIYVPEYILCMYLPLLRGCNE
jgi:hypothetical protein